MSLMRRLLLPLVFLATSAFAETSPDSVAKLVLEKEPAEALEAALRDPSALVRATAVRVIAVRNIEALLPRVREIVESETDAIAAREELRALALLGTREDIALAVKSASKWPAGMDNAVAAAVARRGGLETIDTYVSTLRETRMDNASEFFRIALWGRADTIALAGSRMLANGDEKGWRAILGALADSNAAMNGGVMAASLDVASEDIRVASVWYLVRGYAMQPQSMYEIVKQKLQEPRAEAGSDREDFGREILRRMLGAEKKDDPRWLRFLESNEADDLLIGQTAAHQYLTDAEYAIRYARCEVQEKECVMPRKRSSRTIPSQAVAPPAFSLPGVLPPGLGDAVLTGARCTSDDWIGVATATVDHAGRVQDVDLRSIQTTARCKQAIETILRLSFATNGSVRSEFTGPVLLVHPARTSLCLDEEAPESTSTSTYRIDGKITAPKVLKRAEPYFPESTRRSMGSGRNVLIIVESVISKTGCIRSLRMITQSPFPELNAAALMALSKWKFAPGQLDGKPVDVIFHLTINFKTGN